MMMQKLQKIAQVLHANKIMNVAVLLFCKRYEKIYLPIYFLKIWENDCAKFFDKIKEKHKR